MRICVTDRDIIQAAVDKAAGEPVHMCCPVAQSMKRRGFRNPSVDVASVKWWNDGRYQRAELPPVAAEWIEKYDDRHHVGPFSFELEVTV